MKRIKTALLNQHAYKKIFTRDQSLIIMECWDFAHNKGTAVWFVGKKPSMSPLIFYTFDGAVEEWHSVEQYEWIRDIIQQQIHADRNFAHKAIISYKEKLSGIQYAWDRGTLESVSQLEDFLDTAFSASSYFPIWYYAAGDERTPQSIKAETMDVRSHDIFYDECDRVIRNTLRHLYPALQGLETTILKNEIQEIPPLAILEKRKDHSIFIPGHPVTVTTDEQFLKANRQIDFLKDRVDRKQRINELVGQAVFAGSVQGKVRVIRRLDQMDKVTTGDILVSPMTTPNFLPAMKKAAAFITDEGGMTCHAAIVAREMKKPCIVGTKIATKVLKDGDLVEVDAVTGVVKVL